MSSQSPTLVFKLTTAGEWRAALGCGVLAPSPDDVRDGFIHLSAAHQVAQTAGKYFIGVADLVLVALRAGDLSASLRWEVSRGGDLFPHLYAALPVTAALWVEPIALDAAGIPLLPPHERLLAAAHCVGVKTEADGQPQTGERDR